ncbi:hypothetical protein BCR39DRAFT_186916 [Naematelia encephala]|uniref:Kinase n=1 Tax=Naematelia encephala TaxID=71784 RepID=A0A1Y2B2L5_9TREE|nr:hypothetical protein BCR39DRAFT_186916 [Naematelia encephala]
MPHPLSLQPETVPLANQVAGHQNVMSDASGSLVIKLALAREIAFYQLVNSASRSSSLARLKPFVARFYGTLRLEGRLDGVGGLTQDGLDTEIPESVVLENLAHDYTHPSILDVKLGTILYDIDAKPEKKERMEKQARETTIATTGLRLTGAQTWHAASESYILTPKSFGKTIKPDQLSEGIKRFFPLPGDSIPSFISLSPSSSKSTSTSATSDTPTTASSGSSEPPPVQVTTVTQPSISNYVDHALPPPLLLRLLDLLLSQLRALTDVLKVLEARFVGSSVLIVYEGDASRLSDALDRYDAQQALLASKPPRQTYTDVSDPDDDGEDDDDDEEDEEDDDEDEDGSTSSDSDPDDGTRADARKSRRCPPLSVRMIDFAHTRLVQGEGPDQGVLKGLTKLVELVTERREAVRIQAEQVPPLPM